MTDQTVIDRLLVVRAQSGEETAFNLLFQRWNPKLLGFAFKLSGDPQAARDIAQETWVAVIKGLKRLEDPALFRAWFFRIAHNKAADDIRARQKHRKSEEAVKEMTDLNAQGSPPDEGYDLKTLIDGMPREKRSLLILFYVEGLTIPELAEVFEIPTGTIKSRLHSAREDLKYTLERKAS
ncbi:MAG: RNA polymerase sigma factor [Sphingomonadales bacterium]